LNIDTQLKNDLYQEPYVGMPITSLNARNKYDRDYDRNYRDYEHECDHDCDRDCDHEGYCQAVNSCALAMAYVPWQRWCNTYEPAEALCHGTIFPELDLPFLGGGAC
jgi:hypothetical protein